MANKRELFDEEYTRVDGTYKRLKYIGETDVIQSYIAEYHSQVWDFDGQEINEQIINNLVQFDVDIRYAIDLRSMSLSFDFNAPYNAARATAADMLTNYTVGFDKAAFIINDPETDLDTGANIVDGTGAARRNPNSRLYVCRPTNLIERLEFYLNNSFVGQIPQTRTQMSFPEHLMISSILYGTTPLPRKAPTNNIGPMSIERFQFYRFLNTVMYDNFSAYPLSYNAQKTYQCTVPIGRLAETLGLPGEYLTGNTFTIKARFQPTSNAQINASVYANPALSHNAAHANNDPSLIAAGDTMAILQNTKLYYDKLKDSRATITKDINNLMDVNQGKNVYMADEWVTETVVGVAQDRTYNVNVNVNAGQSPKFIVAYLQYAPPIATAANYPNALFTQRNILPYRVPNGTVMNIDVKYNYVTQSIRNLSFDETGNSVCENMYKILRDKRKMHVGGDFTTFKEYREFYPLIIVPVSKSHADLNVPGQTSSLDNGVVNFNIEFKGGLNFEDNINLRILVISEAWQIRQNARTGVYRVSSGQLINQGFLREGINFADQVRPNIAARVGITPQMLA